VIARYDCPMTPEVREELAAFAAAIPGDIRSRFVSRIRVGSCWEWTGAKNSHGYGQISYRGRDYGAHRLALAWSSGGARPGMHVDHACRNRACVNPGHLEWVTVRQNVLRGIGLTARQARQVNCCRGHKLPDERRRGRGRRCLPCDRERRRLRKIQQEGGA
jgi:hypothetical protein